MNAITYQWIRIFTPLRTHMRTVTDAPRPPNPLAEPFLGVQLCSELLVLIELSAIRHSILYLILLAIAAILLHPLMVGGAG